MLFPVISWRALYARRFFLVRSGMVTVISECAPDGQCYFLVPSACSLLFLAALCMLTVISWWALDGHCYFPVRSGWSVLFLGALWMFTVISWYTVVLDICWWALIGTCQFLGGHCMILDSC